jgi:glycosyltransferase involved in cell wall biosynthesis
VLRSNLRVRCHGPASNDRVLATVSRAHVFAYPATFLETSCMSLIEAMSGGLACIHPDYGALGETASGWTRMYEYAADPVQHAHRFHAELSAVIDALRSGDEALLWGLTAQKAFANERYGWDRGAEQ